MTNFFKSLDQRGSALILSMVAVAGLGVLAVLSLSTTKLNTKNAMILDADKDLQEAVSKVATLFVSPSHCNANFFGAPFTGSLANIYRCTGNCSGGNTPRAVAIPVYSQSSTDWNPANTGLSDRLRLVELTYSTAMQTIGAGRTAGVVTALLKFQKNLGANSANASTKNTSIVIREFNAYVVTSTFSYVTWTKTDAANILGCSRAAASTIVY